MRTFVIIKLFLIVVFGFATQAQGGLISTSLCYSGCAAMVCACYTAAGKLIAQYFYPKGILKAI
jgi:hypothetical protein